MMRTLAVGIGLGVLVLLSGCGGGDDQAAAPAPTVTVVTTVPASPAPLVNTPAPVVTTPAPVVTNAPPAVAAAPPVVEAAPPVTAEHSWKMPSLVGRDLQAAQDAIQELTRDAVSFTTSHDATGAGRRQVLDRGWQVCSQNVAPGQSINADSSIDFGVVRQSESC